jgi:endo-1,4-beta-xylanase
MSLAKKYSDYFDIGAAINPRVLAMTGSRDLIKAEFNSVTCENEMKFSLVHPNPGEYTFEKADEILNFAVENNLKIRGHTLVWHNQTGAWLFENADKEILYARMKEHIDTVMGRYKGKIYCWDVVNEAISDSDADGEYLRANSPYYEIVQSQEFIEKAFIYAHEADPEALLFYNDYNTESPGKRERTYKLLKSLKEKKIPIHGVGLQGHYDINFDAGELQKSIDLFSSLDLIVHVTELDVSVYVWEKERDLNFDALPADRAETQAKIYGEIFEVLRKNKEKVGSVTFWGLSDDVSWLNYFPVKRNNFPLLFDGSQNPKAAYSAVADF